MMLAARAAHKPFVVTSYGIAPIRLRSSLRSKVEGQITLAAYPHLYRSANAVVAISGYIATWLRGFAGVNAKLIPLGVSGVKASGSSRPSTKNLLYVGEISARKGIRDLIEGLPYTPEDVTLDLVGRGSPKQFLSGIRRLHLAGRVRFHGVLEQPALADAYASAFCTCTASFWEGFGLPILEGFSFGRPSIVRAQGGMLEQIQQSGAGCTFESTDEIGRYVDVVSDNWLELSTRAMEFATIHSWRETFRAYGDLFRSLI